jgi:hypothetical protein
MTFEKIKNQISEYLVNICILMNNKVSKTYNGLLAIVLNLNKVLPNVIEKISRGYATQKSPNERSPIVHHRHNISLTSPPPNELAPPHCVDLVERTHCLPGNH